MNIYEITTAQLQLIETLTENGGEITPETESELILNKDNLQKKGINYGYFIKSLDAECEIIDSEIERLSGLKKARENVINRLKSNLSTAMQVFEVEEIKTALIKISFRKSTSVEIINEAQIDANFMVIKTTSSPDKKLIKESIEAGISVAGAALKHNKLIQIK